MVNNINQNSPKQMDGTSNRNKGSESHSEPAKKKKNSSAQKLMRDNFRILFYIVQPFQINN